jgi:hypothetical protein
MIFRLNFRFVFTCCLILLADVLAAQNDELQKQTIIEQRLEIIAGALEEGADFDYTDLLNDLTYYYDNPLNLNDASASDLESLYILTEVQISNLQRHIARYGLLQSLFELQAVKGFDLETIRMVQPFVTVRKPGALKGTTFSGILREGTNDLFLRYRRTVEEAQGYKPDPDKNNQPAFLGSPDYLYTRYRFMYRKNLIAGFTLEKDAGESLEKGPDFASGHVFYRDQGTVRALVVGDYQAQFGQGLVMWNGLGFGKSPFVLNVKKNAQGLRPLTSVNESLFMRGLASTIGWKALEFTAMYSRKKLSANTTQAQDSLLSDDGLVISSISTSGLHRTAAELSDKGTLGEEVIAGNLKFRKGVFSCGVTGSQIRYDRPVQGSSDFYREFRFSGSRLTNVGVDYQGVFRNTNFFGEIARSDNGGLAAVNGFIAALHPRVSISAVHRWIGKDYQVVYANAFVEGNVLSPSNEQGVFFGTQATLGKGWTLSAYSDHVRFPWLRSTSDAPGTLSDHFLQLNYKPDKKHEFIIRYRIRSTQENGAPDDSRTDYAIDRRTENIRLHAVYKAHENVQLRTRAEWNIFTIEGKPRQTGFLIYQDIAWKKMGTPISFNFRYALFDTDSWDTRIYAYESDVLYAFSIPPYNGKGSRAYIVAKCDLARGVDLWLRWGQWFYSDRTVISSGTSQIEGNKRNDLTAQLRWQF